MKNESNLLLERLTKTHKELENLNYEQLIELTLDPVAFFAITQQREAYNYQKEFLRVDTQDVIFNSGRQVGKSTVAAVKALHRAITTPNSVIVIFSPAQRQSNLMFKAIRSMIVGNPCLDFYLTANSATYLEFKNGSVIYSLPSPAEGASIRGFSPNLIIIDEAAYMKDSAINAIIPMRAATSAQLIMLSTPFGRRGEFYKSWNNSRAVKIKVPTKLNPQVKDAFLQSEKQRMTENIYLQEYEAEFISDAGGWFPYNLVLDSVSEEIKYNADVVNYFLGVDCARQGADETVYTIVAYDNEKYKVIDIQNQAKNYMNEVIGRINYLHATYKFKKIYADTNGLGASMDIFREMPEVPLVSVGFSQTDKEALYRNLKLLMEKKRIELPKHEKLIQQLVELEYRFTSNGHISFHHPDNGHDDYPDSLALAVFAENSAPSQNYGVISEGFAFPGSGALGTRFQTRW